MSAEQIMDLVRRALEEKLSGIKNEVAGVRSDLENRLKQVSSSLEKVSIKLPEDKIEEILHGARREKEVESAGQADYSKLLDAVKAIETGTSQVAILQELLKRASEYSRRCALFVVRDQANTLVGWAAKGFTGCGDMSDDGVKRVNVPLDMKCVVSASAETGVFFDGSSDQHAENIQFFEMIGNLDPVEIVAAPLVKSGKIAAVLYADSGDSREGIVSAEAIDIMARVTGMSIDLMPLKQKLGAIAAPARPTAAEAAPAAAPVPVSKPQPVPAAPQPAPARPRPVAAPTPAPVARASAPAVKTVAETPKLGELSPEEQKLHSEARRFARLLVSEIKLYNEAKVVEGRKNRDLYVRLKDDIERSRQMYNQRFPNMAQTSDYFNQEMVAILAEGQPAALGH